MLTPIEPSHATAHSRTRAPVASSHAGVRCSDCVMRHLCMTQDLPAGQMARFEALVVRTRNVRKGEALYRTGEPLNHFYVVRSGSFMSVMNRPDGREQVTGLYLAGDPLGLDDICADTHTFSIIALEHSTVCMVPYPALKSLCRETASMQDRLYQLWGEQLARGTSWAAILSRCSAGERVAAFLLDVSERLGKRGFSHVEFELRMTRAAIGSLLGMTLESVSRAMTRIQHCGLIEVRGKHVRINDVEALRRYGQPA